MTPVTMAAANSAPPSPTASHGPVETKNGRVGVASDRGACAMAPGVTGECNRPRPAVVVGVVAQDVAVDVTVCVVCGGRMRLLEFATTPKAVARAPLARGPGSTAATGGTAHAQLGSADARAELKCHQGSCARTSRRSARDQRLAVDADLRSRAAPVFSAVTHCRCLCTSLSFGAGLWLSARRPLPGRQRYPADRMPPLAAETQEWMALPPPSWEPQIFRNG
jgi:hypothetical protein